MTLGNDDVLYISLKIKKIRRKDFECFQQQKKCKILEEIHMLSQLGHYTMYTGVETSPGIP